MNEIEARAARVRERIARAEQQYCRAPGSVKIIAVSKTWPAALLREFAAHGFKRFGESYTQEALGKISQLNAMHFEWHFIGAIQSNKAKDIARHFSWAHGVDRAKVAKRLNELRPANLPALNICLQVNISDEHSKSGIRTEQLDELASIINGLPNLRLRGLMALPAPCNDFASQRAAFSRVRGAFATLQAKYPELDTLSMGMSNDLEAAIAEGATFVRIGTALFGQRQ